MAVEKFAVLMSIYSGTDCLQFHQSLKSIWTDQLLKPSQIVLVVDGPISPKLDDVLQRWQCNIPHIIKVIRLGNNGGLANALNVGLIHCDYDIVARMDADDVSLPNRFLLQYPYLSKHSEIGILGTQITEWDEGLQTQYKGKKIPVAYSDLCKYAKWRCPLNHPTVMYRKSCIKDLGFYPPIFPEDWALWCLALKKGVVIENLEEELVQMRVENAINSRRGVDFFKGECRVLRFFYKIGYISSFELLINIIIRFIVRCSPNNVKVLLYKFLR